MWIATFVVENWCPLRHQQWDDNACSEMSTSQAIHYFDFAFMKLCHAFASCVQGCGRTSETRLCCPTCIEPGNSILWYLHLAAIHAFFLHSAEPSVKLVEIVFTHSTKCISTNLLIVKLSLYTTCTGKEKTPPKQRGLSDSLGWFHNLPVFQCLSPTGFFQRLGQTSFFCGQEWNRSVGASGVKNLPGKGEKCIRWN